MSEGVFTELDRAQIASHGLSEAAVLQQLAVFEKGAAYLNLSAPCTAGKGIRIIAQNQAQSLKESFDQACSKGRCSKFVPASGAASRMFRNLLALNNAFEQIDKSIMRGENPSAEQNLKWFADFISQLPQYPFFKSLGRALAKQGHDLSTLLEKGRYKKILQAILESEGLNYSNLPKGLVEFHTYEQESRTALGEHLESARILFKPGEGGVRIHFTVSSEHRERFQWFLDKAKRHYSRDGDLFIMELSEQSPSTDTIAVDLDNTPFRNEESRLVFRPGGHGALLQNLNNLKADIVFIKNIDNVVHGNHESICQKHSALLGGLLVELQSCVFEHVKALSSSPGRKAVENAESFYCQELGLSLPQGLDEGEKGKFLLERLNRPIRVCGMVPNEGEPGGGPFWVKGDDGTLSPQIVESSQIDLRSREQADIQKRSTHFNPVDLVCGLRDYKGQQFDLNNFVDKSTSFISAKSVFGKPVLALEHPGLWNGAMAGWITIFVEVPGTTFAPVKEFTDLLRPLHRP